MKASKKLITASAALVAALAVSVGSTYAWFTTNNKVSVENISANVTTGDSNLEVALVHEDGTVGTFGYTLDLGADDEFKLTLGHTTFDALTDNGALNTNEWAGSGKNGLELKNKKGQSGVASTKSADGNYLAFTLRFRTPVSSNTSDGLELKLSTADSASSVTSTHAEGELYAPLVAKDGSLSDWSINKDSKIETNASDAVRIAFHEATGNTVSAADGTKGKVWTPNQGLGDSVSSKNLAQNVEAMFSDGKSASDFDGLYKDPKYTEFKPETSAVVVKMEDEEAYCTADVRIIIWLEGTDGDCLNSIFSDKITIKLAFEVDLENN